MTDRLTGIGGWLAALLVMLGGVGPLFYLYGIWGAVSVQAQLAQYAAEGLPLYRLQNLILALCLAKLALSWTIVGAMLRFRTHAALRYAIAGIWILWVGMVPLDWAGLWWMGEGIVELSAHIILFQLGLGLAMTIPVTAYLLRSRRVANTYPKPGARDPLATVFE